MNEKLYLGIEFGSTRIKAVTINQEYKTVNSGSYNWASSFKNGIWSYDLNEALEGLKSALSAIENTDRICAAGISGMMHGYLAFDENWNLLTPFRTWQNTITGKAAKELSCLFGFNIPQRWSIAHLYQAMLNGEEHISKVAHITTLAGYIHFLLTGENCVGLGEASGIFPIDSKNLCYNKEFLEKFRSLPLYQKLTSDIEEILPPVLPAGRFAGTLTREGSILLDGLLPQGIPFAAPEGDAGTGMTATNAVAVKTGNVSAGTSIFAMVVMEDYPKKPYEEVDLVTTPHGKPVAMVHCNNCTNDMNAWVKVLGETARLFGANPSDSELYSKLYLKALEGEADCDGVTICNYMTGEGITHIDSGTPLVARFSKGQFSLSNFFKSQIYSSMATLRLGMDILTEEKVEINTLVGHGGLFKTKGVGQKYMAAALNAPVTCMETAGEGGPYGMALLAAYCLNSQNATLDRFLEEKVFKNINAVTLNPEKKDIDGFNAYLENYKKLLKAEKLICD